VARVYIAGPMTGLPEFNYPAFNDAADKLRDAGHHVENPAENEAPPCESWKGYMRNAIAQLVKCDAVLVLEGWSNSRGANVEMKLAVSLDIDLYFDQRALIQEANDA